MNENYLISIIIPLFNSENKFNRIRSTILNTSDKDVEFILIDDGSTDNTRSIIDDLKTRSNCSCKVAYQSNCGPGAARNHGLKLSSGNLVWFVDSDDDINPEIFQILRKMRHEDYDFIDFNIQSRGCIQNTMPFAPGAHNIDKTNRHLLIGGLGRLCTKIFSKSFLIKNDLYYPEYCIYEDNQFIFTMPFYIEKFYKNETTGYFHIEEFSSVTRTKDFNSRFLDRILTISNGMKLALQKNPTDIEKIALAKTFTRTFMASTTNRLFNRHDVRSAISITSRMIPIWEDIMDQAGQPGDLINLLGACKKNRLKIILSYIVSLKMRPDIRFFEEINKAAWKR